jgi:glycerophosphoryl diester phosphodiesterase
MEPKQARPRRQGGTPPSPGIFAHRGASATKRENTVEAFAEARRLGADGVELDVRRGAGGALVVHHDPDIPGRGPVGSLAVADLPPHVPLLEAALDACGPLTVNIEVKNLPHEADFDPDETVAASVAALVAELGLRAQVILSSFNLAAIDAVRRTDSELPTGWLTPSGYDQSRALATAAERGHTALHPHHDVVTPELVAAAHDLGLAINTWTVDDPDRMLELAAYGVDAIITNVVDVAVRALRHDQG